MATTEVTGIKFSDLPLHHTYHKAVYVLRGTFFPSLLLGTITIAQSARSEKTSWKSGLGMIGFGVFLGRICPLMINRGLTYSTAKLIASLQTENNPLANYRQIQKFAQSSWPHIPSYGRDQIIKRMNAIQNLYLFTNLSGKERKVFEAKTINIASALESFDTEELTTLPPIDFIRLFVATAEVNCTQEIMRFFREQLERIFSRNDAQKEIDPIANLSKKFIPAYKLINDSEAEFLISYEYSRHLGIQVVCHALIRNNVEEFANVLLNYLPSKLTISQMFSLLEGANSGLQQIKGTNQRHEFVEEASKSMKTCKDTLFLKMVEEYISYCKDINANFEAIATNIEMLLVLYRDRVVEENDLRFLTTSIDYALEALFRAGTTKVEKKLHTIMHLIFEYKNEQVKVSFINTLFSKQIRPEYLPKIWTLINYNDLREMLEYFNAKENFLDYVSSV